MKKIPFLLVTGFLGSGKTTFLKRVLEQQSSTRRIAVVQNEFAPGTVDGNELKRTGNDFEILEVNNGSVFCVCLLGSFVKSLVAFVKEHQPDLLILEASGMSDPISIGEMLQGEELRDLLYLSHIWCFVDASTFHRLARNMPRIRHQVRVADTVVINKTDLIEDMQDEVEAWIRTLNPFARIDSAVYADIPLEWKEGADSGPVAYRKHDAFFSMAASGRPDLGAFVIKSQDPLSLDSLRSFLEEVLPLSVRIKGFVKLDGGEVMAIQSTYEELRMEKVEDYQGPTELMALGQGISGDTFGKRFKAYQHDTKRQS